MTEKTTLNKYNQLTISYVLSMMLINIFLIKIIYSYNLEKEYLPVIILGLLSLTLFFSMNIYQRINSTRPAWQDFLSIAIYILLINIIIYYNVTYDISFIKAFFLLPIIIFSTHFGKKYGLFVASCVSLSILNLNYLNGNTILYDLDVVFIVIFFWMAWLIGSYVDEERRIKNNLIKTSRELKAVNKELEKSQELFRLNFEESHVGMFICDMDGIILKANNSFLDMLGYKKEELIGRDIHDFEANLEDRIYTEINNNKSTDTMQINGGYYGSERNKIWVNQNTTLVYNNNNKPQYYLNHVQDVTETTMVKEKLQLQKEELEYNKLKTKFFANLSHELRTPLNLIFSALQIINIREKNEKQKKYYNIIRQNSYRLLRLVNNIIDLTKLDVNSYQINLNNYDIITICENITFSTKDYVQSQYKDIIFNTTIEKKVIACDPFCIERILLNLISNSVKFTERGDIINVNIYIEENDIIIEVADTGIGIQKEKLSIIFDYFRQVDESFSRRSEGSGIGLSLVKSLVELHEGDVWVESEYGEGTSFYISLPIRTVENGKEKDCYSSGSMDKVCVEFSDIYDCV